VLAWLVVAASSGRAVWAIQHSNLLLGYGAVDGASFASGGWWRLLSSQWLHAQPLHMLLNAAGVLLAGWRVERAGGALAMIGIFIAGGTVGQLAGVLAYPALVSSGASQVMLALCAAAFLLRPLTAASRAATAALCTVVAVQLGLDLTSAQTIKAGHAASFAAGLAAAALVLAVRRGTGALSR
jgi:rhomboid protease GluP